MANSNVCAVNGCDKAVNSKGWCKPHYNRWYRHGSPTAGRVSQGKVKEFLYEEILKSENNECIFWPFGKDGEGYGRLWDGQKKKAENVNRIICQELYGEASDGMVAAHSCGMGRDGCVNPRHLRWATHQENAEDKRTHQLLGMGRFKRNA